MMIVARTERAGRQSLDPGGDRIIYVPPQCAGVNRCPVLFHYQPNTEFLVLMANKYGIITVAAHADRLKDLLARFAIDPERIAILGHCGGGPEIYKIVAKNLNVFSRIIFMSSPSPGNFSDFDPPNDKVEFFVSNSILGDDIGTHGELALALRQRGYRATDVVNLRSHNWQPEEFMRVGQWLTESWAIPDPAARPAPDTVAEVLLTTEAVAKMAKFWYNFLHDDGPNGAPSDFIRTVARWEYQRNVLMNLENKHTQPVITSMMDMPALADLFPWLTDELKQAGLTAQQHDEYRMAIVAASEAMLVAKAMPAALPATTTVLGQNVAFMAAHPDELESLWQVGTRERTGPSWLTGMWTTP